MEGAKKNVATAPWWFFTGVIDAKGFIRHSRTYEGNKADTATKSAIKKYVVYH